MIEFICFLTAGLFPGFSDLKKLFDIINFLLLVIESMVVKIKNNTISPSSSSLHVYPLAPNEVNLPTPGLTSDGTQESVEHRLKESI